MADNLIFPIGFDLEAGLQKAEGEARNILDRLNRTINAKPLEIGVRFNTNEILTAEGELLHAKGSVDALNHELKELREKWNALAEADRIKSPFSGEYTEEAKAILQRFAELTAASESYARTLEQVYAAEKKIRTEQIKAEQQAAKEAEKAEKARIKNNQSHLASSQKAAQVAMKALSAVFQMTQALKAQEDTLGAINQKLSIYQRIIQTQKVGSSEWNTTALQIRRLAEELERATQQMRDFQQQSFSGLSGDLTKAKVQELTQYREQLRQLDAEFNKLNQTGKAFGSDGRLTADANNVLKQREAIEKRINQMLVTAADAQKKREQEINHIIEQRKAKLEAVAAKRKAEQQAIQVNINRLKEERRVLAQKENSLNAINDKLRIQRERLSNAAFNSKEFEKAAKEVQRLSEKLKEAETRIKSISGAEEKINRVSNAFKRQDGYVSRLVKRLAVYASFSAVGTFIRSVREITAQFELQRVSLGAIIQDQQRANKLFSEIKTFALQSPLSVLDLTKYTKQLAAYKIGVDDLFGTTKRLADISVGLGVSMDRIILMYGQIRAAGYLRASEVRQATEAGIPLVEELAKKLTALNGKLVSAADVMDMISKRQIGFEMVKEVFEDMTSAGGAFYNMQQKQAQTLYGMWAKLGDAASIMYEEIGNTAIINAGMKSIIQLLTDMMNHWTSLSSVVGLAATGFLVYKAALFATIPALGLYGKGVKGATLAEKAHEQLILRKTALFTKLTTAQLRQLANTKALTQAEWERIIVEKKLNSASAIKLARMAKEDIALRKALISQKLYTAEQLRSIQAMNKWQYAWARTKAGFMGFGNALKPFLPIAALTLGIDLIIGWVGALKEKEEALKKVNDRYNELRNSIENVASAFMELKEASKSAVDENSLFNDKMKQLQEVVKLLSNYGLDKQIDISIVTPENIDSILESWLNKLYKVNEVSKVWGSQLSENATQFDWMGIFGENLNEDMKDLTRTFTKITNNVDFTKALDQMRATISYMSQDNKELYESISKAIQGDATLALSQKKRNETELQYQQRIYKEYKKIYLEMQKMSAADLIKYRLPSFGAVDAQDMLNDFQADLNEVMHEINKTIGILSDEEPLTIKMAIDEQFALNNWAEWQKEAVIQELNKDRLKVGLELIPYYSDNTEDRYRLSGVRAIMSTEFKGLITDADLEKMTSYAQVVEAVKTKYEDALKRLKEAQRYHVEINTESEAYKKGVERIKVLKEEIAKIEQLNEDRAKISARLVSGNAQEGDISRQLEIERELSKLGASRLLAKQEEIKAITERNKMANEGIEIEKKAADEEAKRAKEALDRLTTLNISDIAKDVIGAFSQLKIDPLKVDAEYSRDFLISDDELEKIANIGDLYDIWAKNTKAIAEEQKKLAQTGISQIAIEREKNRLAEQQKNLNTELAKVEQEITSFKYSGLWVQYQQLLEEKAIATTTEQIAAAEKKRAEFLGDVANAEFAILIQRKEGLESSLLLANQAQVAQQDNEAYLKSLEEAKKLYEEIAKRYNFRLFDKSGGGSGEDPWIILMKNRMKFMQDFQKGVEDLSKFMGETQGLSTQQENMLGRGLTVQIDSKSLEGTKEELVKWYEDAIEQVRAKIGKLGGKEWSGLGVQMILGKDTKNRVIKKYQELLQELFKGLTDFRTDQIQKELEEKLKRLADKVSRTKTAKEFYDKILAQTGNADLANRIAEGIYGTSGSDLFDAMVEQIQEAFQSGEADVTIGVDSAIDFKNQRINYAKLAEIYEQYQEALIDKNKATAKKIVEEGQKTTASNILNWQKELAKAQDYEEQRTEIVRKAHEQRQEIIKQVEDPEERARLIALSYEKQAKALADLSVKEFKAGEDFIKVFQNLDMVSNATLSRMKKRLEEMIDTVKDAESVEGLKTLIEHLEKIDEEQKSRDPFGTFIGSIRKYIDARKKMREAEANEAKVKAEYAKQEPFLDADITSALNEQELAQTRVNELKEQGLLETNEGIKAQLDLEKATQNVVDAENAKVKAQKKVQKAEEQTTKAGDDAKKVQLDFNESTQAIADNFSAAASTISSIVDMLGIAADSELGEVINGMVSALQTASSIMSLILTISTLISAEMWWVVSIGAAVAVLGGLLSWFTGSKVRKANKIIEEQKELVEQLEYSYNKLEKAIEKAFGREYLSNYNQQLKNLYAQQLAYQRMAEAERSKGKKEDKEKTKEYLNNARDIANQIEEMKNDLAGKIVGEDLTSAARGFAEAWVEAKLSFSNTKDAILKEFDEMVKEMVMNQVMGAVAQTALKPFFDQINELASDSYLSSQDIVDAVGMIPGITQSMIQGFEVAAEQLRKAGFDIMSLGEKGEYSGIAKNISNATSEEINNAAAIGNSLLFHVSGISRIDENVGAIRRMMELGAGVEVTNTASGADTTERQNKAMAHYAEIEANTAETVVQLRQLVTFMQRVMTTQNGVYGINTYVRK